MPVSLQCSSTLGRWAGTLTESENRVRSENRVLSHRSQQVTEGFVFAAISLRNLPKRWCLLVGEGGRECGVVGSGGEVLSGEGWNSILMKFETLRFRTAT